MSGRLDLTARRGFALRAAILAAVVLLAASWAVIATTDSEQQPVEMPVPEAAPDDDGVIEQIERDSESVITGRHFTYDPAGRRDPFEPLIKAQPTVKGKRPKGIAGMMVAEIALKGVAADTVGNPVALFRGSDNRGYALHEGDVVYDAHLISIDLTSGTVVFRQEVDDPRRIKPYRDVVKKLHPDDEENAVMEEGS
jgi:hypothetical protein